MTPAGLTLLGMLLLELRDWIEQQDPGSLDAAVVDRCVDICGEIRRNLTGAGAR